MRLASLLLTALLVATSAQAAILQGTSSNDILTGAASSDEFYGREGNDQLYGYEGDDRYEAGPGNDTIYEKSGNDRYVWAAGDGQDVVRNIGTTSDNDTLEFGPGVLPQDIQLSRVSDNLLVTHVPTGGYIHFIQNYDSVIGYRELQHIVFADGTQWSAWDVRLALLQGTSATQTIQGYDTDDTITAGGGNDTVYGNAGDDNLAGEAGNDTLYGGPGDDLLDGGAGTDVLRGEAGNDTYIHNAGDEGTTIYEQGPSTDFDELYLPDFGPAQVILSRTNNNLVITANGGQDVVQIVNWYATTPYKLDQLRFSDHTVLSQAQIDALGL